jgi:hypothetical protein
MALSKTEKTEEELKDDAKIRREMGLQLLYAIIEAQDTRNYEKVKSLVKKGADVNAENREGQTPLIVAVKLRDLESFSILISKYPNIAKADRLGENGRGRAAIGYLDSFNYSDKATLRNRITEDPYSATEIAMYSVLDFAFKAAKDFQDSINKMTNEEKRNLDAFGNKLMEDKENRKNELGETIDAMINSLKDLYASTPDADRHRLGTAALIDELDRLKPNALKLLEHYMPVEDAIAHIGKTGTFKPEYEIKNVEEEKKAKAIPEKANTILEDLKEEVAAPVYLKYMEKRAAEIEEMLKGIMNKKGNNEPLEEAVRALNLEMGHFVRDHNSVLRADKVTYDINNKVANLIEGLNAKILEVGKALDRKVLSVNVGSMAKESIDDLLKDDELLFAEAKQIESITEVIWKEMIKDIAMISKAHGISEDTFYKEYLEYHKMLIKLRESLIGMQRNRPKKAEPLKANLISEEAQ